MNKSNNKERICIDLAIDPKCQGDLEGHMVLVWPQNHMDYQDHSDQIVAQSNEN